MSSPATPIPSTNSNSEKWGQIKSEIKKNWSKLSDDDLEKTKGDQKKIETLVQNKYNEEKDKDKNNKKISDIFQSSKIKKH